MASFCACVEMYSKLQESRGTVLLRLFDMYFFSKHTSATFQSSLVEFVLNVD